MRRTWLAFALGAVLAAGAILLLPAPGQAQSARKLRWERLEVEVELRDRPGLATSEREQLQERLACFRTKVPGGWLVMSPRMGGVAFYPDPQHTWNGGSLD